MTSEVIIKNKSGIVLAADSAVTVTTDGIYGTKAKVYNSANKLFMLSKKDPVGVLIYNSSTINDIPAEIIIKEFRAKNKSYKKLKQYQEALVDFIESFINKNTNSNSLFDDFSEFLNLFSNLIRREVKEPKTTEAIDTFIKSQEIVLEKACITSNCPDDIAGISLDGITAEILSNKKYEAVFENFKSENSYCSSIENIIKLFYLFLKLNFCQSYTGIAVCGYGEDEFFPKVHKIHIYGIFNKKLLTSSSESFEEKDAQIIPLAQKQMIHTFMHGVSDQLLRDLEKIYYGNIPALLELLKPHLKEEIDVESISNAITNKINMNNHESLIDLINETQLYPLLQTVDSLSRDEMAELAESLINIQVLKYKVSLDLETVGGPIDVAIISKHDGFVWKKRKLYFPADLNFQFFENYFKQ